MVDADLERYALMLGHDDPQVRRLTVAAARSGNGTRIAKSVLRARLRQIGVDPDDPTVFAVVTQLPLGLMRIGQVINGASLGPVFAIPEGNRSNVQHLGVFGQTRWGKTYMLLHLTRQYIEAGGRCWILDVEDEYAVLLSAVSEQHRPVAVRPCHLRINFFEPPTDALGPKAWLEDVCLVLRQEMYLRDGSLNLFAAEILNLMKGKGVFSGSNLYPSLAETREWFANLKLGGAKARTATWLESLLNRLNMLHNTFEETVHVTHSDMLQQLAGRSVIFRLRSMRGIPLQFLSDFLLTWLARYRETTP